jgi:hypothetical protein
MNFIDYRFNVTPTVRGDRSEYYYFLQIIFVIYNTVHNKIWKTQRLVTVILNNFSTWLLFN